MAKRNARVEEARARLYAGDESARKELSELGKMGAKIRWARWRAERLRKQDELEAKKELAKEFARLSAEEKMRQANEDWCPPH